MKLNFYSRIINRISNWQSVVLASIGFLIVGVFLMVVKKPLSIVIENAMGIIFLLCAVVSGVSAFAIFHSNRQNGEVNQSPIRAIIAALIFLIASGLIFFTDFFGYLFIFGICLLIFIEGAYNFLMGLEIRRSAKTAYYFLVDGVLTALASLIIFIIVLKLMREGGINELESTKGMVADKKVTAGEIIIFFLALKFILLGVTTFLIAWAAKKLIQKGETSFSADTEIVEVEAEIVEENSSVSKKS